VLLLAQDGNLSLDDPVRKYIPELPDYGSTITVRHLLNHTSGLRDWGEVADIGGRPRGTRVMTRRVIHLAAPRNLNQKLFALLQRAGGSLNRLPDHVTAHNHFDPAVLLPSRCRVIRSNWPVFPQAKGRDV
jgi:CubicO group peptidase (beta-lactamase class C family)